MMNYIERKKGKKKQMKLWLLLKVLKNIKLPHMQML